MGDTKNTSNSSGHTADEYVTFFANKVDDVRQSTSSTALPDVAVTAKHALNEWELVTPEVVVKLIGNAPNKSCQLDVAPTWLVKQYSRLLAPFIALLFMRHSHFPQGASQRNLNTRLSLPWRRKAPATAVN